MLNFDIYESPFIYSYLFILALCYAFIKSISRISMASWITVYCLGANK